MNATTKTEITKGITELGGRGRMIRIADLLDNLADRVDVGPAQLAEYALDHLETVTTAPESNQKTLTVRDRETAIFIGGQEKHLIMIG